MFDWFHKMLPINSFYVLLVKILHRECLRNVYTRMLEFTFSGEGVID